MSRSHALWTLKRLDNVAFSLKINLVVNTQKTTLRHKGSLSKHLLWTFVAFSIGLEHSVCFFIVCLLFISDMAVSTMSSAPQH